MQGLYLPILITSVLFAKLSLCFEIPNVKFNSLTNGFSLSLTGEPEMKKVLYMVKINNQCPGFVELHLEPQTEWTSTFETLKLKPKDQLHVAILVDHNGKAYKSIQIITVGETKDSDIITKVEPSGQQDKCNQMSTLGNCEKSQTTIAPLSRIICKDQLIFEENFDVSIDAKKWSFDIRNGLNRKKEEQFVLFDNRQENIFLNEGYLNIRPTFTQFDKKTAEFDFGSRCTPVANPIDECKFKPTVQNPLEFIPPVNSSQIHTKNTFKFKYGRVEVRAKLPKGDWLLPYIMLQNVDPFERKQIRIAFARGNEHKEDIGGYRLYGGIVKDVRSHNIDFKNISSTKHYGDEFHNFTLTWTKDAILMAVDGAAFGKIDNIPNEFDKDFFITLGVSVGGHFEFPDNLYNPEERPWHNTSHRAAADFWQSIEDGKISWSQDDSTMRIDYLKVYAV